MNIIARLAFPTVVIYLWVMMILLGSVVMETFMVYPNVFHDPPASLELAMRFMSVRGPGTYFPPLGFLSWVMGISALVVAWPVRPARDWIVLSVALIVCEGVVSMLFFWPRNQIMFVEGASVHSVEVIRQTAREFQLLHWSRLALNVVSAAVAFVGCLRFHRAVCLSRDVHRRVSSVAAVSDESEPMTSSRTRAAN